MEILVEFNTIGWAWVEHWRQDEKSIAEATYEGVSATIRVDGSALCTGSCRRLCDVIIAADENGKVSNG